MLSTFIGQQYTKIQNSDTKHTHFTSKRTQKKKNSNKMHIKFDCYDNYCIFGEKCTTQYYERIAQTIYMAC